MTEQLNSRLQHLSAAARKGLFQQIRRGLEKETLRITPTGRISQRQHPKALGSTLTNPHITTDYSEALMEYITPVDIDRQHTLDFLQDLHRFTFKRLDDNELLWPMSMPCRLDGNDSIRIAEYGTSNVGRMKYVYRRGLDVRYGRIMQAIAGIHYNLSFPDELWPLLAEYAGVAQQDSSAFQSDRYFALIRNFRRHSWLLLYLFGASPVVDQSFLAAHPDHGLEAIGPDTFGLPHATSLRMSDLGYQNEAQSDLHVCFNTLDNYVNTLTQATQTPYGPYQELGVRDAQHQYQQLNTSILQIENEYYSDIRPKRVARSGQKPSEALDQGGVEYIEVRCLDINPFLSGGIDVEQMRFLDVFLLFCLLADSPEISDEECQALDANKLVVARQGRHPETRLSIDGHSLPLATAGHQLCDHLEAIAVLMDQGISIDQGTSIDQETPQADIKTPFQAALAEMRARLDHPERTPSARLVELARTQGHLATGLQLAQAQHDTMGSNPIDQGRGALFAQQAQNSLVEQADIEASDTVDFDTYLADYFGQAVVAS